MEDQSNEPEPHIETLARVQALEDALLSLEARPVGSRGIPDRLTEREARSTPVDATDGHQAPEFHGDLAPLFEALSKAQAEIHGAVKDSANPHLKSSYADLASVFEAVRAPLTSHGLSVLQTVSPGGAFGHLTQETKKNTGELYDRWWTCAAVSVETILAHDSGAYIRHRGVMTAVKAPGTTLHQAIGAAATYLRRYQLAAICGVPQVDDDGNGHTESTKESSSSIRPKKG